MNQEEYNQRKIDFESQKDSLPKEPSGTDVKKNIGLDVIQKMIGSLSMQS